PWRREPGQSSWPARPSGPPGFVTASPSRPWTRAAYRRAPASYQPQRRGRPVTAPYSLPLSRSRSPISPNSSVGSGPSPTRVVYAFATPSTWPIAFGGSPSPVHTPPTDAFDEVTYG